MCVAGSCIRPSSPTHTLLYDQVATQATQALETQHSELQSETAALDKLLDETQLELAAAIRDKGMHVGRYWFLRSWR